MKNILVACAVGAVVAYSPAYASHDASQYTGQPIGTILGTFSSGGGTFTGTQVQNSLMPYMFYGVAGDAFTADTVGSSYDTGLSLLFKGSSPIVATDVIGTDLTFIASNDDFFGLQSFLGGTFANTGYYALTVGGFGGDTGSYTLNFQGGSALPGVPEPTTWALLILGFGAVGAGMRRRTTTRVAYA